MMDDSYYMRLAIAAARVGMSKGNSPFGAAIVNLDGNIVACGHNEVLETGDPTAHAEIVAIKKASKLSPVWKSVFNSHGQVIGKVKPCTPVFLKEHTIYSSTEPCVGCLGFIHWARIKKIVYGVSLDIAAQYGFNELKIYNKQLQEMGGSQIEIISNVLEDECMQLFRDWTRCHGETY